MNEILDTQHLLSEIIEWVKTTPWKADYQVRLERMYDSAEKPCVLAIAGKVNNGKSSFLNSLLGADLAMVANIETTATINVFRYGHVSNPEKPVMVYWNDGREPEAQSKEFLDSLQGASDDVLSKAEKIDRLEYIIDDERLKNITLVDTPGFASIVDEHEKRIDGYFNPKRDKLRSIQIERSLAITEKADAVIFINGKVAQSNAQQFFGERIPYISPFNAIGVMTKIDEINLSDGRPTIEGLDSIASEANKLSDNLKRIFEHELFTVLPVSAGIYRSVEIFKDNGRLKEIQEWIRKIPQDVFIKRFNKNALTWGKPDEQSNGLYQKLYEKYGLTEDVRLRLSEGMPWMVFCTLAIALYYLPLDKAVEYLVNFSGMEVVKRILNEHFFSRSRSIRCASVLREAQQTLSEIKNIALPKLMTDSKSKEAYINVINNGRGRFSDSMLSSFEAFVKKNIPDIKRMDSFSNEIDSLLVKIDNFLYGLQKVETLNEGQRILQKTDLPIKPEERQELDILFSDNPEKLKSFTQDYINKRLSFWKRKKIKANSKDVVRLAKIVCTKYIELLDSSKDR